MPVPPGTPFKREQLPSDVTVDAARSVAYAYANSSPPRLSCERRTRGPFFARAPCGHPVNFAVSAAPFVVPDQPAGKQIDLLVRHGMTVLEDELENAVLTLRHIGHIRLSEYWQSFCII